MRHNAPHRRMAIIVLAALFAGSNLAGQAVWAQTPPPAQAAAADEQPLTQPQLEALLAPIALYPDDLLMQMLMAATYPLEIVQAERWLRQAQNAALRGDALVRALNDQSWDASVKSLVPFPDVLKIMSDKLDWTQQVGDAVLAQQEDVLNAVQVLRGRAQAAGTLKSGAQQTVTVTQNVAAPAAGSTTVVAAPPQIIVIEPAQPNQVFVPAYNPSVMFGTWPHPGFPPVYYPPPASWGVGNALLTGMAFAAGTAVVGSLWGWARPGWGRGYVDVNVNRVNNINVNRTQITSNRWQHDVSHRQGVAYRNREVNNRFRGGDASARAQSREQFRGRAPQAGVDGGRPNLPSRSPGGQRVTDRGQIGANRPGGTGGGGDRPSIRQQPNGRPVVPQNRPPRNDSPALQGIGDRGQTRAAAQRGQASRQGQAAAQARSRQGDRQAARPGGGAGSGRPDAVRSGVSERRGGGGGRADAARSGVNERRGGGGRGR